MSDDEPITHYAAENDFAGLSSEQIEICAIGDVNTNRKAQFSAAGADSEQAIEYEEKRNFAIDEDENADPMRH